MPSHLPHASRRQFLRGSLALVAVIGIGTACAPAAPATAPTAAPAAKPTEAAKPAAAAPAAKPAEAAEPAQAAPAAKTAPAAAGAAGAAGGLDTWTIGVSQEAAALDLNITAGTSPANQEMFLHIYDNLVRQISTADGAGFKIEPMLAESYRNLDPTTWEIKLRQGVKWHDGSDFTSDDVKYTWDDFLGAEGKSRYTSRAIIEKVEAPDPYTVRVTTKGPQAAFIDRFAASQIMPRKARTAMGPEKFNEKPIGTGPYKVVEWTRGQQLVLEANEHWWGGKVFPKKLVIRPLTDPTTRIAELKTGNVQIIQSPSIAALKELQADPNVDLSELKGGRTMTYKFNITKKPFDDVRVRQAINLAVDRDAIIKSVLEGYGVPLVGQFSPGWDGYEPELKPYPYDPAKAKELLSQAGVSNLELNFSTTNGVYLKDREIAEAVAGQMEEIGVKTNIIVGEPTKLINDWGAATFEGVVLGPWGTAADPDGMLNTQYYQKKGYQDAQLDSLIEKSRAALDPAARTAALKDVNKYIHEQALNLSIHSQSEFWAKRKEIDWTPYPVGSFSYALLYRVVK